MVIKNSKKKEKIIFLKSNKNAKRERERLHEFLNRKIQQEHQQLK